MKIARSFKIKLILLIFLGLFNINCFLVPELDKTEFPLKGGSYIEYIKKFGVKGTGAGKLLEPCAFAIDKNCNIYILDSGERNIEEYDKNGNFIKEFNGFSSGSGNGQMNNPNAIAIDSEESIYISDAGNFRIQKFINGTYYSQWGTNGTSDGQFKYPIGISIDKNDNIYITDKDNDTIQKFSNAGVFLSKFGGHGSSNGLFDFNYIYDHCPGSIGFDDDNNIYIADTNNHKIQKISSSGSFISSQGEKIHTDEGWGSSIRYYDDEKYYYPISLASDGKNIFVFDSEFSVVKILDTNLGFIKKFGHDSRAYDCWYTGVVPEGAAIHPHELKATADGTIFVFQAGSDNFAVYIYQMRNDIW